MQHQGKRSGPYDTEGQRGFFRLLASETVALFEELRGKPLFQLTDLGQLTDEVLAQIMPKLHPEIENHRGRRAHHRAAS